MQISHSKKTNRLQELLGILADDRLDKAGAESAPVLQDSAPVHLLLHTAAHHTAQLTHLHA